MGPASIPLDHPRKMDAQKGEIRIGNRIDQVTDERTALGANTVIFTAERDDAQRPLVAGQRAYAVTLKAGAIHYEIASTVDSRKRISQPPGVCFRPSTPARVVT